MPFAPALVLSALYVVLMSFAGRAHGAATEDELTGKPTGWPTWGRTAATVLVALSFAAANYLLFAVWWLALLSGALSAAFFSTGHGRFYDMKGANLNDPKPEWIEKYIASWAWRGDLASPRYSWFCMGVKGLGVGLAAAPFGLALAYAWPALYAWSFRTKNDSAPAEHATGAAAGAVVILSVLAGVFLIASL